MVGIPPDTPPPLRSVQRRHSLVTPQVSEEPSEEIEQGLMIGEIKASVLRAKCRRAYGRGCILASICVWLCLCLFCLCVGEVDGAGVDGVSTYRGRGACLDSCMISTLLCLLSLVLFCVLCLCLCLSVCHVHIYVFFFFFWSFLSFCFFPSSLKHGLFLFCLLFWCFFFVVFCLRFIYNICHANSGDDSFDLFSYTQIMCFFIFFGGGPWVPTYYMIYSSPPPYILAVCWIFFLRCCCSEIIWLNLLISFISHYYYTIIIA